MKIKSFTFNPFSENTYVLYDDSSECIILDPGCYTPEEEAILVNWISENNLTPSKLVNTHCHIDHICGNAFVAKKYGLILEASQKDEYNLDLSVQAGKMYGVPIIPSPPIGIYLPDEGELKFGNTVLKILFTPGHSSGSLSFYHPESKQLLSGDVLFNESIGRYDLPGGNFDVLENTIRTKLYTLPPETVVYSGHGQATTIAHEMKYNPFVKI